MSIQAHWQRIGVLAVILFPLSLLFRFVSAVRRGCYRIGLFKVERFDAPVIVVGNITVGGSGKTPLVIWLVRHLREKGFQPGLVARGYRGRASSWPQQVRPDSDPGTVGDEAVLLAQQAECPVCVGPDRPQAVRALLAHTDCDVVISDDGLQHYAMDRDIEIAVIDGQRRFGNQLHLPAGPLREPLSRLDHVDLVVGNGETEGGELLMTLERPMIRPLRANSSARPLGDFSRKSVRAIAGIGNPQRFFDMLTAHGLKVEAHAFPDHHDYKRQDLQFPDDKPLLMTEKDAVKCRRLIDGEAWVVSIQAQPEQTFIHRFDRLMERVVEPVSAARSSQ